MNLVDNSISEMEREVSNKSNQFNKQIKELKNQTEEMLIKEQERNHQIQEKIS